MITTNEPEMKYAVVKRIGQAKQVLVRTRTLREAFDHQKLIVTEKPKIDTFLAKIMKNGQIYSLEEDVAN